MENLYSKLYDKYNKLKTRKDSEIDRYNHDQEVKFTGYMAAVEELVNCLRSENDRLVTKNQDLRNELASVRADRSDKEELCVQYEKLLTEETRKGKELSEEVEKLRNLQQEGLSCSARGRYNENGQMESPRGTYVESIHLSSVNNRKRLSTNEDTDSDSRGKLPVAIETERDSQSIQKESCCGKIISSGGSINANCVFHTLLEFLIGMKFEFVTKADGPCLSALHQSSGPVHSDIYFGTSFQVASYPAIFRSSCIKEIISVRENLEQPRKSGFNSFQVVIWASEHPFGRMDTRRQWPGSKAVLINHIIFLIDLALGFSFTLTWLTKASENEPLELLYHVLSLGTFERIAPEWMREDLIFSSSMCPVFFKRVSSVIGLHL